MKWESLRMQLDPKCHGPSGSAGHLYLRVPTLRAITGADVSHTCWESCLVSQEYWGNWPYGVRYLSQLELRVVHSALKAFLLVLQQCLVLWYEMAALLGLNVHTGQLCLHLGAA